MRLWHKDLISYLPSQQLLGQWRECCCIARNIAVVGNPNHLLVNKIMDYPIDHFLYYAGMVYRAMINRGYKCDWSKFEKYGLCTKDGRIRCSQDLLFVGWHNDRYLKQCYCNLEEKYDCGGISEVEWLHVARNVNLKKED